MNRIQAFASRHGLSIPVAPSAIYSRGPFSNIRTTGWDVPETWDGKDPTEWDSDTVPTGLRAHISRFFGPKAISCRVLALF